MFLHLYSIKGIVPKDCMPEISKLLSEPGIRRMERPESSEFDRTVALVITQKSPGKITGLVLKRENHEPGDYPNAKI